MRSIFKTILKWTIAISRWVDYIQWKRLGHTLLEWVKMYKTQVSLSTSSPTAFIDVMKKFHVSETDLIQHRKYFYRLVKFWLSVLVLTGVYSIYLAIEGAWLSFLCTIVSSSLLLCQIFRYHFWAFQILQRRCDCTLAEWWQFTRKRIWRRKV